ncbi:MAG TPA: carboxypeptidase-like regulatory domain-containing protein [Blastocatellia bacterium]|nr:carboxypeptidase-like regulatory domain-containing protein [Blastocatellia bacterium]
MTLMICGTVPAQSGKSSVRGTVLDPNGQVVAGAQVTLASSETNSARTQTTNDKGVFGFDLIAPGAYRIEVEVTGFKKSVLTEVSALVDKTTSVDIHLEVGNVSEAVSVSAGSADVLLNKQDATIGNNFQNVQITQLPLESRNVVALLSLQPGVTPDGTVTGSRADQANITLDGVDVNEQQTGLDPQTDEAFASVLRVSPDSTQEFRVTTTNPNATQGRSSGAQVALVTKSGTNQFSGSLYAFHRNTVTTANDFFNNRSIDPDTGEGIPRPKLLRNLFGGSLGGPIKKDRFFFFYNYEGRRDSAEETVVRVVPLASLGRGEIRFPDSSGGVTTLSASDINNIFPEAGVNPVGLAVLADAARRYQANATTVGDGFNTAGFRFNAPTKVNYNANIMRLDYNLTSDARHLLFFRGNYQQDLVSFAPQFPDTPSPKFWAHPFGFVAGHTWTVNNALVNDFKYGLTRLAFTNFGDSDQNFITFRFVFEPRLFSRTVSRTTPVHNITDDVSWTKGSHGFQFGTNIRIIRNHRDSTQNAFDFAVANPSFYDFSGAVLTDPFESEINPGFISDVRSAVSAVIGRFSDYGANFNFDKEGNLLPSGLGLARTFATEEYDWYAQDSWKLRQNLTLTLGLRYGLSRPVYEANGLQVKPTTSLNDYFEARKASALQGKPFNEPIEVDLAGPVNGRDGYYPWDTNNFQPRVAVAWSPNFKNTWLRKILGSDGDAVIRGGFAMTNDHIGQQLAVQFDLNSTLGFTSNKSIAANTYNVTDNLGPRFTSFGQDVRSLEGIVNPGSLTFPLTTPADEDQRIEYSLDDHIVAPVNYNWNVSYGRKFKGGLFVEASYIGRRARNLLAGRDIMALNNLVDPKSGLDWYSAATQVAKLRLADTPIDKVQKIPYFENLFPNLGENFWGEPSLSSTQSVYQIVAREDFLGQEFFDVLDWTFVQLLLDDFGVFPNMFFQPQYAALATFGTIASSDYHAGTLSIRQRFRNSLQFDFNYTLSHSTDDASGLQISDAYDTVILNPLRPQDSKAASNFDMRHIINANALWQLPIGKGHQFLNDGPGFVDGIVGGWQLSGIFRWNSGLPVQTPFDAAQWATNWNVQSNGVRVAPFESSPTRGGATDPNIFSNPKAAYNAFRNAFPGETGDRNVLRLPGYVSLDLGLAKSFTMPFNEKHKLQFRWEVFNVTNTQRLTLKEITRSNLGLNQDSQLLTSDPGPSFGKLDAIQGSPRVMQFGLRYTF